MINSHTYANNITKLISWKIKGRSEVLPIFITLPYKIGPKAKWEESNEYNLFEVIYVFLRRYNAEEKLSGGLMGRFERLHTFKTGKNRIY